MRDNNLTFSQLETFSGGVARLQKGFTLDVSGVARLQKGFTLDVSGIAIHRDTLLAQLL